MSTVVSESDLIPTDASQAARARLPAWTREPLLHFIVLGALLFAVDSLIASREDDPNTIVLGAALDAEANRVFESSRGRLPNEEELAALRRVWLDNEVLYREGLALGLDKGDEAIRERVIFKALSVVDAGTKRPPYDDEVLKEWFEQNRGRYDQPARYDFEEAVLSGQPSEDAVRAFVSALNAGNVPDAQADLRVFTNRPHANLVQSYGEAFASALEQSPPGEWRALRDAKGWRAVRLEAITAPVPADFEQLRGIVLQDWTDAVMSEQRTLAVRALAKKYKIKIEGDAQ